MKKKILLILVALALATLLLAACTPQTPDPDTKPDVTCEHEWGDAIEITAPTCSATGTNRYICKKCNGYRDELIPKLEHVPHNVDAVPATCYQEGTAAGVRCMNCNVVISGCEATPKAAHTPEAIECCSTDSTTYYSCTVCNLYFDSVECTNPMPEDWTPRAHNWSLEQGKCLTCNKTIKNLEQALRENYAIVNAARLASATPQNVVSAAGYAYFYQRAQIYYDQNIYRRNYSVNPEDATEFNRLYLDCSSYVNNVYGYAFGKNLSTNPKTQTFTDYCGKNIGTLPEILYYVHTPSVKTKAEQLALVAEIRKNIQPGDLVVYRHGSSESGTLSGHIMMYVGNDMFLHSTGSSMAATAGSNPDSFYEKLSSAEVNGSVMELSADSVFDPSKGSNRYLFYSSSSDTTYYFGVFRPIGNRSGISTPTASAICRYVYSRLEMEKSASVNSIQSVQKGQNITYTVTLKNAGSQAYNGVYVKETLPSGVEFVSASEGYIKQNNVLYFVLPQIEGGSTVTVSYTVKVTASKGAEIVDDQTYVNDIKINSIYHSVETTYDRDAFAAKLKATVDKSYSDRSDFVSAVYSADAAKLLNGSFGTVDAVMKDLYANSKLSSTSKIQSYMVRGMFGGLSIGKNYASNDVRSRAVNSASLQCGDIIVAYTTYSGKTQMYYFVDESTILVYKDGKVSVAYDTEDKVSKFLITLYAYNSFTIVRPSLI